MGRWSCGAQRDTQGSQDFQRSLEAYQKVLVELKEMGATTAGYVDKPAANLVVRLLEIASLREGGAAAGQAALSIARRGRPASVPGYIGTGRALGGLRHPVRARGSTTWATWRCTSST